MHTRFTPTFSAEQGTFEPRRGPNNKSRYAAVADGKVYRLSVADWGHESEEKLERAFRGFAKRKGLVSHVQKSGKGYVTVQSERKF